MPSEQYQIATIEATPDLCSQNLIHLGSILVYLCIKLTSLKSASTNFFNVFYLKCSNTQLPNKKCPR